MRYPTVIFLVAVVAASCYFAGYHQRSSVTRSGAQQPDARKVLYYVDPMTPGFRADKPGTAPCGMPLEPVYAEAAAATQPGMAELQTADLVRVKPGMEQMIGVQVEAVRKAAWSQTIRLPGTVLADENRVYRITAATDGWVKKLLPPTTDSLVHRDQVLATFYAPEFFSGLKAYLYALKSLKRTESAAGDNQAQLESTNANLENYKISLRNLGMTESQLDSIQRTMQGTDNVEIRAPASGVILNRNISNGQRFMKGSDLYRIADLSRVWILADVYDNAALAVQPGMRLEVSSPYLAKPLRATVEGVPPKFDPATRTLKLRLAADNPGQVLRPDMFVDVAFKVALPPALTVPAEALLDSGLKKSVFVEVAPGSYQPRQVETGRTTGDRVEIVKGVKEGERVVVSGNFLLDSESRMKRSLPAGAPASPAGAKAATASAAMPTAGGATAGAGSAPIDARVRAAGTLANAAELGEGSAHASTALPAARESEHEAVDPNCGMHVDQKKAGAAGLVSRFKGKSYYFCSDFCKSRFNHDPAGTLSKREALNRAHESGEHHD